jgi:hypothetical protein
MVSNLLLLVLWSEWCGGRMFGFNWEKRVLGDYRTALKIKRSQPSAAPTGQRISNVKAAEGCDLLIFKKTKSPPKMVGLM